MLKGNKIMWLLVVLVLLVGVFLVVKYTGNEGRSKSFRSELVAINKDAVTKVVIVTPTETTTLEKTGAEWTTNGGKHAVENSIKSMLSNLESIQPSRLASRKEETWKDFQVDTSGTRVTVYEGSDKTLDIVLGRFNVEGQRSFYSYVRLADDSDVYVAKDFMKMGVGTQSADYRNGDILQLVQDSVSSIAFNYPDSGFVLSKANEGWLIGQEKADSVSVSKYLQGVRYLNSEKFSENPVSQESIYTIVYSLVNGESITVSGYTDGVIGSSYNTYEYWEDDEIVGKLLKGEREFK